MKGASQNQRRPSPVAMIDCAVPAWASLTECGNACSVAFSPASWRRACLLLLIGTPAYAQPPVTTTTIQKDVVENFVDVLPTCEGGPDYVLRRRANLVSHESVFEGQGRSHGTFTQTGTFVAEPLDDPSLPS